MGRLKIEKEIPGRKRKVKRPKDANQPKRATTAYFFFMANCRDQAKKAGKNVSKVAEFTKECSEKWKNLSSTQRKPFDEKAAKDKSRYDKEMAEFRGKTLADPDKPKRPQTSYFCFLADFRKSYVPKDQQNAAHKMILKEAGEKWRGMAAEEKRLYEKKSEEEGKKYKVAMAEYNKKSGGAVTGGSSAKKAKVVEPVVEEEDDDEEEDDEEEGEEDEVEAEVEEQDEEEEEDEEDEDDD